MSDRVQELASKRAELLSQLAEVSAEMRSALDAGTSVVVTERRTVAKKNKKPKAVVTEGASDRQPSLSNIVLGLIKELPEGVTAADLVRGVTSMKEAGKYKTNAKSITAVVSQALNKLKENKQIKVHKSDANKNLYTATATQ